MYVYVTLLEDIKMAVSLKNRGNLQEQEQETLHKVSNMQKMV